MVEFRDGQFVVVSELLHGNSGAVASAFDGVGRACPRTCGEVEWRSEQTGKTATRLES